MILRILIPLTIIYQVSFLLARQKAANLVMSQKEFERAMYLSDLNDSILKIDEKDTVILAEKNYLIEIVEEEPVFQGGGVENFMQYVQENIMYPETVTESSIDNRVIIQFIVDKEGSVKNVEILRGIHPAFDEEAVRVVISSPKWEPGMEKGNPVDVQVTIPVKFILK